MHDSTNTKGGRFGFVAVYEGGREVSELAAVWDEVPRRDKIVELRFVDFSSGLAMCTLRGYKRFFFANEAVSAQALAGRRVYDAGDKPVLSAKILGGVNGEQAIEVRIDLLGPVPQGVRRDLPAHQLPYSPSAFRPGAG